MSNSLLNRITEVFKDVFGNPPHSEHVCEGISGGIIIQDETGKVRHTNLAASVLLGLSPAQLQGNEPLEADWSANYEDGSPWNWPPSTAEALSGHLYPEQGWEIVVTAPDKRKRWLMGFTDVTPKHARAGKTEITTTLIDITERKQIELHEGLLKAINQLVLIERPQAEVLRFLCNELVQNSDYQWAWIGIKEPDGSVSIQISVGVGTEITSTMHLRWDDTPAGQNLVGKAIRTGQTEIHNLLGNCEFDQLCPLLRDLGIQSIAALPLRSHEETLGVLVLYGQPSRSVAAG